MPLGARKVLSPFDKNDINSVLHYLVMSDRLVDNYFDNPRNLFEEDVKINLKLNVEEAFYYKSGALCERTHVRIIQSILLQYSITECVFRLVGNVINSINYL